MTSDLSAAGPVAATPPAGETFSAIGPLVIGERHWLAADREISPQWPADVVVGQQDPGQIWVPPEHDPEEVVGLALLELGRREQLYAGVDLGQRIVARIGQHRLDPQPLHAVAIQQLVVDAEARLGWQVVRCVQAGEEAVALARRVAQPGEHGEDLRRVDDQRRLAAVEAGVEHRAGVVLLDLPPDQLQSGGVRHGSAPALPRTPPPPPGSARGGQPGMWRSIGMNLSAPWTTA